ncbi:MAG: ATP synthase subunit I [Ectothiorhodospiraceae bacterium]|nr:ATP synthase subunit I [Ectothiorhodospiraceae bacterium]
MTTEEASKESPETFHRVAYRIVGAQLLVASSLAGVAWPWLGFGVARSVLVGGLICVAGSAYLAMRVLGRRAGRSPRTMVRGFYAGEAMKILLTASMFAAAIVFLRVDVLAMLVAYMVTSAVYWFALVANLGRRET